MACHRLGKYNAKISTTPRIIVQVVRCTVIILWRLRRNLIISVNQILKLSFTEQVNAAASTTFDHWSLYKERRKLFIMRKRNSEKNKLSVERVNRNGQTFWSARWSIAQNYLPYSELDDVLSYAILLWYYNKN